MNHNRIIATITSMSHEQQEHLLNKVELSIATNNFFAKPINKPLLSTVISAICDKPHRSYHYHSQQSKCRIIRSASAPIIEQEESLEDAMADARTDMLYEQTCSDCQRDKGCCCDCTHFDLYLSPDCYTEDR